MTNPNRKIEMNPENEIPTPITDAKQWDCAYALTGSHHFVVDATDAKALERRAALAEEELAEVRKDYMALAGPLDGHDCAECVLNLRKMIRDLAASRAENARLREVLEGVCNCITPPRSMTTEALQFIREALAVGKEVEA